MKASEGQDAQGYLLSKPPERQYRVAWLIQTHYCVTAWFIHPLSEISIFLESSRTTEINPWLSGGFPPLLFSSGNRLILQTSVSNELSKFIARKTSLLSKLLL